MRSKIFPVLLMSLLALAGCDEKQKSDFITVEDGIFMLAGEPYYFMGANYWTGIMLGSDGPAGNRDRLIRELDQMKAHGITNLRVMVGPEGPANVPNRVTPPLIISPGEYNEDILHGLDFLLAEMGKRGQHAILFLNNAWDWSGGYAQYLNWNGYGPIPNPFLSDHTWKDFMDYSGLFNNCEPCISMYEEFIRFIVGRTNSVTGVKYTDDPVIMAWEIANEPRAFSQENIPAFEAMISRIAALFKELDGNHLVTTGSEGLIGCEGSIDLFERIHTDPAIDYLVMHIWPKNWGWLDATDIPGTMENALDLTNKYIDEHLAVAERLKKPIVLEEFGLSRDNGSFSPDETTIARDLYYANAFSHLIDNASRLGPLAGCNFWAYSGTGRPPAGRLYWQAGDDYLGDPPHEEQGLYSVFDTDSTMRVVATFAEQLSAVTRK